jgi:hypothetical protein
MKQVACLDYTFMFDPSEVWQHASQFESSLAGYLSDMGFETQIIKPLGYSSGSRIIYITPIPPLPPPKPPKASTMPAGKQIRELGKKIK